jgi:uncharacterized protein YyaL (SSP411 family)
MSNRMIRSFLVFLLALPALAQQTQTAGNALANANSRYLRDAAASQVMWRPWGPAAFDVAKKTNRPIFLSIGYASSWESFRLHREAFGNPAIAETLNGYYIPVLVDRFELPEVAEAFDKIQRVMTGAATVPSNFVLTPALEPFATIASTTDLRVFLAVNASRWANERETATEEGRGNLVEAHAAEDEPPPAPLDADALRALAKDPRRDPIGGGFHHSATRREKLLPDQAAIALAALEAWQKTREPLFEELVRTTLDYAARDLRLDRSGFWVSQDAHSLVPGQGPEMHDGAFYANGADTLEQRLRRPQPFRDFTEIAGFNGLMISALARAGAVFGETRYRDVAVLAAKQWPKMLYRTAEDSALMVQGLLDLFDSTYDLQWLEQAKALERKPRPGNPLPEQLRGLLRKTPAVNAIAARNQARFATLAGAGEGRVVVVVGDLRRKDTHELLRAIHQPWEPGRAVIVVPETGKPRDRMNAHFPYAVPLAASTDGTPAAYACQKRHCRKM